MIIIGAVALSVVASVGAVLLARRYGPAAVVVLRQASCRHTTIKADAYGSASFSANGEASLTIAVTCARCGEFWHVPLDATRALREGMGARR